MWSTTEVNFARVMALRGVPYPTTAELQSPAQAAEQAALRGLYGASALLGEEFTLPELHRAMEALWDTKMDMRNFYRQWAESPYLTRTGRKVQRERGRPGELYTLNKEVL